MKKSLLLYLSIVVFTVLSFTGCNNPSCSWKPTVVNIAAIQGLTVPVTGKTPVTVITPTGQYSGTVTWNGNPSVFAVSTVYTATITLTAQNGYTLQGVGANFFTVEGATSVSNNANSGLVTVVFPATGQVVQVNPSPVAEDFIIENLTQTVGNVTPVTIVPKAGISNGTLTIFYNGSTDLPTTAGTYAVTFNVAKATGWEPASGLVAGTLTINAADPVPADYTISGIGSFTYNGSPRVVTVMPKPGKSSGEITVKYKDSTTPPSAIGTYTVTFDVAETSDWNEAKGLSAGTLTIRAASSGDGGGGTTSRPGGAVGTPTLNTRTHNSITINAVSAPSTGQSVEYAINTSNIAPSEGWQTATTFGGLNAGTRYYIFARSASNNSYYAGAASGGLAVITTPDQSSSSFSVIFSGPTEKAISITKTITNNLSKSNGGTIKLDISENFTKCEWYVGGSMIITGKSVTLQAGNPAFVLGYNWITVVVYDETGANATPWSGEFMVLVTN